MSAPPLRVVADRPLFDAESDVKALVDRLAILDAFFENANAGAALTEGMVRAIGRLIGEAVHEARAVERAWDAEFGARA